MKRSLVMITLALLGATWCVAHASDASQTDQRQREEAAKRQAAEKALKDLEDHERRKRSEPRIYRDYRPDEVFSKEHRPPSDDVARARMFAEAAVLERQGKGPEAVELYQRAARAGSGKAARRLAEIYDSGIPGVQRDSEMSRKWNNAARALGEDLAVPSRTDQRRRDEAERQAMERALKEQEEARRRKERELEQQPRIYREPYRLPAAPGLFEQAAALEQAGKGSEAVAMYARAARAGNGKAARRLFEIYDKGIPGVSRDYAESLKWGNLARVLGEDVPTPKR